MQPIETEKDTEEKLLLLEEELHECYCQTGRQLMEIAGSQQKQADALIDEIIRLRTALALARQSKRCERCGGLNAKENRHCCHCGLYLRKEQTS